MARYKDAVCRLCRREGTKLFLKGAKCFMEKCPVEKRNFAPGQHGKDRKAKIVGYGLQLREKQKAKRMYFAQESQFRNYFEKAARAKGVTGEILLQQLERRLDSVVYRLGFAVARRQARQLVRHGHIAVNGRKVNIPSFQVNVGEEIAVRESSRKACHSGRGEGVCFASDFPDLAGDRPRELQGPRTVSAAARRYQPARQRAAHRRTVQQVTGRTLARFPGLLAAWVPREPTPLTLAWRATYLTAARPSKPCRITLSRTRSACGPTSPQCQTAEERGETNALEGISKAEAPGDGF